MADGSPPNKRQKTVGGTSTETISYDLENELPDDLLGSGSVNSGLTNGPSSVVSSNQSILANTGQQQVCGPPSTSLPPSMALSGPKQLHLKQLLAKSDRNSPKYAGTPSPSTNNAISSPRMNQTQQSPMHSIQSPTISGGMVNMGGVHGMTSPQGQNMPMPSSLPRPNSAMNPNATPSPRPGSNHMVNASMSNPVGNSISSGNLVQQNTINSSINNNIMQQQAVSSQHTVPMASQNNMMVNNMQPQQHQMSNGSANPMPGMQPQQTMVNGPMNTMPRQNMMMPNSMNQQPGNYMPQQQMQQGMNMNIQVANNSFNPMRMPHKGMIQSNAFPNQQNPGIHPQSIPQPMVNNTTFMTRTPNVQGMLSQGGNQMINTGGMTQSVINPHNNNNQHMMQPMDKPGMNQFSNRLGAPGVMQTNNGMPQNPGQMVRMPINQSAHPGNVNIQQQPVMQPNMSQIGQPNQMPPQNQVGNPGMLPGSTGTASAPSASSDPEKRRLIQQQLVLLLHAYKCSKREEKGEIVNCTLPHCRTMKDVLRHMNECTQGKSCQTAHCASSRQIIAHWTACKRSDCVVCLPLKNAHNNNTPSNSNGMPGNVSFQPGAQGNPPTTNSTYSNPQQGSYQPGLNGMTDGQAPPQILQINNMGQNQGQDLGGMFQIAPPKTPHEWHKDVTDELRMHLVRKLVQAIIPQPQKFSNTDDRMKKLTSFARKVEGDMYEQANNRGEYYHLLAEKIYKIQKELEEKRSSRNKKPVQQHQGQVPNGPIPQASQAHPGMATVANSASSIINKLNEAKVKIVDQVGMPNTSNAVPHASVCLQTNTMTSFSDTQAITKASSQAPKQTQLESLLQRTTPPSLGQSDSSSLSTINTALSMSGTNVPYNIVNSSIGQPNRMQDISNSSNAMTATTIASSMPLTTSLTSSTSLSTVANSSPSPFVSGASVLSATANSAANQLNNSSSSLSSINAQIKTERMDVHVKSENNWPTTGVQQNYGVPVPALIKTERSNDSTAQESQPFVKPEKPDMKTNPPTPSKSNVPRVKKEFSVSELCESFLPVVEKLYQQEPEASPFRVPVDPDKLNIPDYFDIVKKPIDLTTIRMRLDAGSYEEPWKFIDDIWLMFNNAWLYNRRTSRVYKYCSRLKEIFEQEIDPIMQSLGYCCGRKLEFMPMTLCCYGKQLCTIPTGATYYEYQNSNTRYGLIAERYDYCEKCFNDIQGDSVLIGDDPTQAQSTVSKSQFIKKKNNVLDPEPFVNCKECGRALHKICVLHNSQIWSEFICDKCHAAKGTQRKANKFMASKLPQNKLGEHIERRVNKYLKENDKNGEAGHVHIRVVYVGDKTVEVRSGMKTRFVDTKEMPESFPYRAKAFFAFEEIDGVDVCFFGVHVQEYGSEAPQPNQRRVYLSYLDSVHFFRPRHLRTAVYHEILIGYFEFCKNLGYEYAHIWACPPCEGDDYIFHCHPPEQKIPKPKRLQDWYKKMLDKAIVDSIVVDYKDIFHQAKEDRLQSARELPYFEGDFWPNVLEESIKELEQEEEDRKQAEATEQAAAEEGNCANSKNGKKTRPKKGNSKKASQRSAKKKLPAVANDLSDKLYQIMEKHKEVFFVMRLNTPEAINKMGPTTDPDNLQQCELMDGRDNFLTMAREKHYEFSSLRRTKWSTMAMLVELHTQGQDRFVYTCNNCKNSVEAVDTRFHCTVCEDFDLCSKCYQSAGHHHKMEQMDFGLGGSGSPGAGASNNKSSNMPVQRCMQSLVHACQCKNANCNMVACKKMKRIVAHARLCKRKTNGSCQICKQLIALCCYHAKHCQETKCSVAFCYNIKDKLRKQEQQQRINQAHLMRRRMALMSRNISQAAAPSTPANPSTPQDANTPKSHLTEKTQSSPMPGQHDGMMSKGSGAGQMQMPNQQIPQSYQNDYSNHNQMAIRNGMPVPGQPGMMMPQQTGMQINQPQTQMQMPGNPPQQMTVRPGMQPQNPPQAAVRAAKEAEELAKQQAQNTNNPLAYTGMRNQTPMPNPQQQPQTLQRPPMPGPGQYNIRNMNPQYRVSNINQINTMNVHPNNQSSSSNEDLQKVINLLKREPQNAGGASSAIPPNKKIKNTDQVLHILKNNPKLMATIIKNKKFNRTPNPHQMQNQQHGIQPMQMSQPINDMVNNMNQPGMQNVMQQHQMQQSSMQWPNRQMQQPPPQQQQQQQQFSQPAPPYSQAVQQQRMMNHMRMQQQQQQQRFQRPHSMPPHHMQQGMMSHQQHPGMMGVPQVNTQVGVQPVPNSRPPSQPGLSPHPMPSPHHVGAGRTTPLGGQGQVMNQPGMPNMGGNMDPQFNPNSSGGMMTGFNRPMGNMGGVGQMNPHMGFNAGVPDVPSNAMQTAEVGMDKFVNEG